jgi:peptidoglycan/xylan/chitin deacetylase (PgdA/CDA1 family)
MCATVFVVSANLGRTPQWDMPPDHPDRNERIVTVEQLRSFPAGVVTIGSHTRTHPKLTQLPPALVRMELRKSREELEAILGRSVDALSVPYGLYDEEVLHISREAGYSSVFTTDPEVIDLRHASRCIGRFKVTPDDWMIEFKLKALGAYRWRHLLRQRSNPSPTMLPRAAVEKASIGDQL